MRRTLAGAAAALVLALIFLTPFAVRPVDTPAYYMGLALFLLTLLPVVVRLMTGDLDVFEPIVPISLLIGLAFGIRAMYLVVRPELLFDMAGPSIVRRLHLARAGDGRRRILRAARRLLPRRETRRHSSAPQPLRSQTHVAPHDAWRKASDVGGRRARGDGGQGVPGRICREQHGRGHKRHIRPRDSLDARAICRVRARAVHRSRRQPALAPCSCCGQGFCRWQRCNRWHSAARRRSCSPSTQ